MLKAVTKPALPVSEHPWTFMLRQGDVICFNPDHKPYVLTKHGEFKVLLTYTNGAVSVQ